MMQDRALFGLLGTKIDWKEDPKLAFFQQRVEDPHARTLERDMLWLTLQGTRLNLQDNVLETAMVYLQKLRAKGYTRYHKFVGEAVILLACRAHKVSRTPKEIVGPGEQSLPMVKRAYEIAQDALGVGVQKTEVNRVIFKAVETLDLPREFYHETIRLLPEVERTSLSGHPKTTNAGAIIYILAKRSSQYRTAKEIASAFGKKTYQAVTLRAKDLEGFVGVNIKDPGIDQKISKAVETIGLGEEFYQATIELLPQFENECPSHSSGEVSAGAILYCLAQRTGHHRTAKEIALALGIKEKTLRGRVQTLKEQT